jgi:hypothetical protein
MREIIQLYNQSFQETPLSIAWYRNFEKHKILYFYIILISLIIHSVSFLITAVGATELQGSLSIP